MTRRKLNPVERKLVLAAAMKRAQSAINDALMEAEFDLEDQMSTDIEFDVHFKLCIDATGIVRPW